MDTSKNRLFLATLILIGLGFLVGVYLSFTEYSAHGQSVVALKKARSESGRLLGGSSVADVAEPVALKQGNVDSAQKDLEDLKAHIAKLRETVSGKPEAHIEGNPKTSNTLNAMSASCPRPPSSPTSASVATSTTPAARRSAISRRSTSNA